ncbi:hypothetical protein BGZ52_005478 [Haplosporangium bisporale]|nr:hypothetical protein BGZ52_005478 [Haplosporangium bisporale]
MATATSTALAIPEVLASVLAYLDHTDLRAKVAFVCKDWYILCRRLTKAQYHWLGKIPLDKRYLFQQGGSAHVLPIISRSSTNYYIRPFKSAAAYGLPDWSRLHKLVSELPSEDQEHFCKLVAKSILDLQSTLELAQRFQCPDLVEFRMQHCTVAVSSSEARQGHQECLQNNDSFTRSMVLNLLQKYCPQLNSIHFSLLDSRPTEQDQIHMFQQLRTQDQIHMFQQLRTVQSWSIAHSDLLPSTFESLRLYASALISLELCCSCNSLAPETLHRYLCQAPRLQQLSIDNMVFPVEYLDLEYPSAQEAMQSNRNQVWACRNLRSLQIKFGSMTGNDTRTPKRSRHLFAYIAQVCPRLQQLHITRSLMNVQKEGGLCYLSGIESLERLTLQTTHFQTKHISDFGWIKAGASSSLGSPLSLSPFSTISSETSFTTVSSPSINGNAILRLTSRISRARKQTRNVFGGLLSRVTSMRSRSSSPDPLLEDRAIVKKIIQYASEENIKATMDKLAKRNGVDPVWPRLEYLVLDAVKYSGVSPESMAAIVAEARPGACTLTSANYPKLLVPLVQQVLAEIEAGTFTVPAVPSTSPSVTSSTSTTSNTANQVLDNQVRFIRRLRESIYKGSVLCGGPYGINALGAVSFALDPELSEAVNSHGPVRGPNSALAPEEYQKRGRDLFQTIYQHHTDPILTKIGNSSQDLVQSILRDTYGKVLADTALTTISETELCLVATLVPLNVPPQLKSHVYGSRNVGVPMEQVQQLVSVADTITSWVQSQVKSSI